MIYVYIHPHSLPRMIHLSLLLQGWENIQPIVDDNKTDVSSPVVAIPTVFYEDKNNDYHTIGGWFGKFNELMAAEKYNDEFTAVHFYFDYPGDF